MFIGWPHLVLTTILTTMPKILSGLLPAGCPLSVAQRSRSARQRAVLPAPRSCPCTPCRGTADLCRRYGGCVSGSAGYTFLQPCLSMWPRSAWASKNFPHRSVERLPDDSRFALNRWRCRNGRRKCLHAGISSFGSKAALLFSICTPPAAPPWRWAVCLFSGSLQRSHDRAGSGRPFTVNRKQGVKREVFSKIFDVENLEMLRIFRRLGQP